MTSHTAVEVFRRVLAHKDFTGIRHFETVIVEKEFRYAIVNDDSFFLVPMAHGKQMFRCALLDIDRLEETEDAAAIADSTIAMRSKKCEVHLNKYIQAHTSSGENLLTNIVSFFTFEEGSILLFVLEQQWKIRFCVQAYNLPFRVQPITHEAARKQFANMEKEMLDARPKREKFSLIEELAIACERYRFLRRLCLESQSIVRYLLSELHEFAATTLDNTLTGMSRAEAMQCGTLILETLRNILFDSIGIWGLDRGRALFEIRDAAEPLFFSILRVGLNPYVRPPDLTESQHRTLALNTMELRTAILYELMQLNQELQLTGRVRGGLCRHVLQVVNAVILCERMSELFFSLTHLLFEPESASRTFKVLQHAELLNHFIVESEDVLGYCQQHHSEELKYIFTNPDLLTTLKGSIGRRSQRLIRSVAEATSAKIYNMDIRPSIFSTPFRFVLPSDAFVSDSVVLSPSSTSVPASTPTKSTTSAATTSNNYTSSGTGNNLASKSTDDHRQHQQHYHDDDINNNNVNSLNRSNSLLDKRRNLAAKGLSVRTSGDFAPHDPAAKLWGGANVYSSSILDGNGNADGSKTIVLPGGGGIVVDSRRGGKNGPKTAPPAAVRKSWSSLDSMTPTPWRSNDVNLSGSRSRRHFDDDSDDSDDDDDDDGVDGSVYGSEDSDDDENTNSLNSNERWNFNHYRRQEATNSNNANNNNGDDPLSSLSNTPRSTRLVSPAAAASKAPSSSRQMSKHRLLAAPAMSERMTLFG